MQCHPVIFLLGFQLLEQENTLSFRINQPHVTMRTPVKGKHTFNTKNYERAESFCFPSFGIEFNSDSIRIIPLPQATKESSQSRKHCPLSNYMRNTKEKIYIKIRNCTLFSSATGIYDCISADLAKEG